MVARAVSVKETSMLLMVEMPLTVAVLVNSLLATSAVVTVFEPVQVTGEPRLTTVELATKSSQSCVARSSTNAVKSTGSLLPTLIKN